MFETTDETLEVSLHCAEFTCRCPLTGQPDWATITITYSPGGRIVESKSVKLYMETFGRMASSTSTWPQPSATISSPPSARGR